MEKTKIVRTFKIVLLIICFLFLARTDINACCDDSDCGGQTCAGANCPAQEGSCTGGGTNCGFGVGAGCPLGYTCVGGDCIQSSGPTPGGWTCFPSGTDVTMSDGSKSNIEDVEIGEKVMSQNEMGEKFVSTVTGYDRPVRDEMCRINFKNNLTLDLTSEHPLFTTEGWKSIDPVKSKDDTPNLPVTNLEKGDVVVREDGVRVEVASYSCWSEKQQTYNLILDGDVNTYFAEGFLAHNKGDGGFSCPAGMHMVLSDPPFYYTNSKGGLCFYGGGCAWPEAVNGWVGGCLLGGECDAGQGYCRQCSCVPDVQPPVCSNLYWCRTSDYSCNGTTLTYDTSSHLVCPALNVSCEQNLQIALPGQTTGECFNSFQECDVNCNAPCSVGAWINDLCGAGGCAVSDRFQTRDVNPRGCAPPTRCVADASCVCTTGAWTNGACGVGGCAASDRYQTRTVNPVGCDVSARCVADASCIACTTGAWTNGACGVGGCAADQRQQTRTTNPVGCDTSSRCVADASCVAEPTSAVVCTPGAWTNSTCGGGSCAADQREQTRTVNPVGCAITSRCVADAACASCTTSAWTDASCGAGTCGLDQMQQTRTANPAGCASTSRCVADASCVGATSTPKPPTATPATPSCDVSSAVLTPSSRDMDV